MTIGGQAGAFIDVSLDPSWDVTGLYPCPGALGAIQQGAHADLLLINSDPLNDINLIAEPAHSMAMIMKAGVLHKGLRYEI